MDQNVPTQNIHKKNRVRKLRELLSRLYDSQFKKLIWIFLFVVVAAACVIFILETGESAMLSPQNGFLQNFFDSIWYTIVTFSTVGYGDISPKTEIGKLVGILMIFGGVTLTGAVTGKIASLLVDRQLKEAKGLIDMHRKEGHFIVCGWKNEISNVLKDIMTMNPDLNIRDIVIVNMVNQEKIEDLRTDPRFNKINYLYGDYSDETVLNRANIKKASTVFILADDSATAGAQEIDSKTVMTVMMIDKMNRDVYICAELLDKKFQTYLEMAHCDEIILSRDYSRILLANASSASGISHVITQLIEVGAENPLKTEGFPPQFVDRPIKELKDHFMQAERAILVGILENTGNFFQRKKEALKEAQKTPDISKLVINLKQVKTLKANHPIINPSDDYVVPEHSKAIVVKG